MFSQNVKMASHDCLGSTDCETWLEKKYQVDNTASNLINIEM